MTLCVSDIRALQWEIYLNSPKTHLPLRGAFLFACPLKVYSRVAITGAHPFGKSVPQSLSKTARFLRKTAQFVRNGFCQLTIPAGDVLRDLLCDETMIAEDSG